MLKVILFVIIVLSVCILWVIIENNFYKRKNRKQREKDDANVHSKRQIEYYKGENKPKPEHDWIEFNLN